MTSELRNPVEVLGEEFVARRRRNESVTIQEYVRAHPEFADQIRDLFPAMLAMEKLKVSKNESSSRPIRLHVDRLERLGDYRIIREIGHGGMGIVYEAEQQSLHRRVAVKVFPKQAIGDSQQLQRFQREAETAGGLHHTNIVPVFGVGEQDGLHYFVMQLLEGVPLDEVIVGLACRSKDASIQSVVKQLRSETAIDLQATDIVDADEFSIGSSPSPEHVPKEFPREHWRRVAEIGIQVADALEYAHSKGVLHRDVKPSNLILGKDSQVWVTDFGLAIASNHDRLSRSGDVVGTLRYMSPEQLAGRSDRRSDVYGLGLTLYELLTLRPAFEGESRGSLIRKVSRSSPPAPRTVCPQIPRDLETIVLKAIARSPDSRYRSAQNFADDLRRFCQDRPIMARRIGPLERVARWSRRNPAMAGMTALLFVGALCSFAAVSWNWRHAVHEKQNAEVAGARAESNLTLALGSMDRLLAKFESDWMAHPIEEVDKAGDAQQTRFVISEQSATILEDALKFYDQFAQQNRNSIKLQRDTAKAYRRAGDISERLGRHDQALQSFRRSAEMLLSELDRAEEANELADSDLIVETSSVLNRAAMVLHTMNRSTEARGYLEQAKQLISDTVARKEPSLDCVYELALTHSNLGLVLWRLHESEDSMRRHRRAILLLEGLTEQEPDESKFRIALARAYRNYFPIAAICKERVYANEIRQAAEEILQQLVIDFPGVPDYRCELSEMLTLTAKRSEESSKQRLQNVDRAVQLASGLSREFRSVPRYQTALARALTIQGSLQRDTNVVVAGDCHEQAGDLMRGLQTRFPEVNAYRLMLAETLHEQALTYQSLDRTEESICVLEEAISQQSLFLNDRSQSVGGRRSMSTYLQTLANILKSEGDSERAEELRNQAASCWRPRPILE